MDIRKLTLAFTLSVVISCVGMGGVSAAGSSCPIGFTGPNSDNKCISTTTYSCIIDNDNVIQVDGENVQGSISGNAGGLGGARTGSATNSNNETFNITVTTGGLCQAVQSVTPTTPTTPGGGTGSTTPTTPNNSPVPTRLANTGGDNTSLFVITSLIAAGLVALTAKFGLPLVKHLRR